MNDATTTASMHQILTWQIGDVRVTRIPESPPAGLPGLLPDATPEAVGGYDWLAPFLDDRGRLLFSIHCLVLETPSHTIVVDTCIGNDKPRKIQAWNLLQTDFLDRFEGLGFARERIDTVLCTHMHVDHVGWNTRLVDGAWVPTFPNARYLYAEKEWAHFETAPDELGPIIEDSVRPIFDAGLADLVPGDHRVCDEVRLIPSEGHTPGHVSVLIESLGEQALITGDAFHHPCQIAHPEWASIADYDQTMSTRSRHDLLARLGDRDVLVIGTHFTAPGAGHVVSNGDRYALDHADRMADRA